MKALIVGGGIGGLAAALCLLRAGHEVTVLERAGEIAEVGAGLQLSPNATRVLADLGVLDRIEAAAFRPEAIEMRLGTSGAQVFRLSLGTTAERRWGAPYLHVHRADLIAVLAEAVEQASPGAVSTGTTVTGYDQTSASVTACLSDGTARDGDLLIGADGIHSTIRSQMLGADSPRFTGNVAWRATVPVDRLGRHAPPPTACVWAGSGRHAVTYYLRGGRLANFVGVVERTDWQVESWSEAGAREAAAADFAGWDPVINTLIDKADMHLRWALFDRAPLARWHDGHVALLGDACHPMLPFLAQGAAMAIEDAATLAGLLTDQQHCADALARYTEVRLPRTSRVQAAARANMTTFHHRSSVARLASYGPLWLGSRIAPAVALGRLDWLYGHAVQPFPIAGSTR